MSYVKNFGAVGDGVADDTAAIQHAVNDGDGVVEFSRGTYRITKPIVLDLAGGGPMGIRGDRGTARVVMAGPGPAFKLVGDHQGTADPKSVQDHTWDKERFPIVSGIEIVGDHAEADGIELFRTMQTTIDKVAVRLCRHGIHLVERNRNFLLSNSHIYENSDTGLFLDDCNLHQVNILGNHISYNARAGIRQWNGDVHNVQITGNDIEYNSGFEGEGTTGEIVLEAPNNVVSEFTISSNTIQATREAAGSNIVILGEEKTPPTGVRLLAITGNVLGSRSKNIEAKHAQLITLTGNTIYGGTQLNADFENCRHVVVSSNTFLIRPTDFNTGSAEGVRMTACQNCSLTGNLFNDTRLGNDEKGGAVTLEGCEEVAVSNCQILDPVGRGVHVIDSSRCRISDNTILERGEEKRMRAAIEVSGASNDNLVQNNLLGAGSEGAVLLDPSANHDKENTVVAT